VVVEDLLFVDQITSWLIRLRSQDGKFPLIFTLPARINFRRIASTYPLLPEPLTLSSAMPYPSK
jgi:hypothetical protein